MKTPVPLRRAGFILGALLLAAAPAAAAAPREAFLAAKQAATDANFRNDQPGLRAALEGFAALEADPELGDRARYHAAWTGWMLAASHFQDQKPADALAALEPGVARLRRVLESAPDDAEAHALLAWMLVAVGSAEPARFAAIGPRIRDHRQRALELAPQNPRVVMLDATLQFYSGQPEVRARGLARWQEALELVAAEKPGDPTRPDWGRTLAEGWLANLHLSNTPPDLAKARSLAAKALRERPDWWWVATQVLPKTAAP